MAVRRPAGALALALLALLATATAQQCGGYGGEVDPAAYGYGTATVYGYGCGQDGVLNAASIPGDVTPGQMAYGSLVGAGGVMECEGTVAPQGPDLTLAAPVLTSTTGLFSLDASAAALVAFPPGCVDRLTKASIKYWNVAPTTPGANVTVSPVGSLAEAYRRLRCFEAPASCRPVGDTKVYSDVYHLLGFNEQPSVDFASWTGIVMGTRYGVSVYIINQRVLTALTAVSEVLAGLCGEEFITTTNPSAQMAAHTGVLRVLQTKASGYERRMALSDARDLAKMMEVALEEAQSPLAGLMCQQIDSADRSMLFSVLAKAPALLNSALGLIPSNTTAADGITFRRGRPDRQFCAFRGMELTAGAAALSAVASSDMANAIGGALADHLNAATAAERSTLRESVAKTFEHEFGTAGRLSRKSATKAVVPKAAVSSLEDVGVACVACKAAAPAGAAGLNGLWGLMGLFGLIGIIPAGIIGGGLLAMLPPGIIFIIPGLVLVPFGTALSDELVRMVVPSGGTKFSFPGSCRLGIPLQPRNLTGVLPDYIVEMIPQKTCLPPGRLWYVGELPYQINPPEFNWPPRTVVIPPKTIILPPGADPQPPRIGSDDAMWYPNGTGVPDGGPVEVLNGGEGGGTIVVSPPSPPPPEDEEIVIEEPEPSPEPVPEPSPVPPPSSPQPDQRSLLTPPAVGGHGGGLYLLRGPPPGSCPGTTLPAIPPLSNPPGSAERTIRQMFGAFRGIGYLQSCAGDFYYHRRMDPADKDVEKDILNKDRTFGVIYKDFITGPASGAADGYFGVEYATGPGQAHATDAWADAPDEAKEGHCIDTWTLAPVTVPIAGLTPYPADIKGQPDWAAQVVVTPLALLTLGNTSEASVADKYDAVHALFNATVEGGLYGDGMINSDPAVMLAAGDAALVGAAVGALAGSGQVLNTLALARALYECREGDAARLSNELVYQWTQALVKPHVMLSAPQLSSALKELCLTTCVDDAAMAVANINQQLASTAAKYRNMAKGSEVIPITLNADVVRLAKLAKVGQQGVGDAVRACCSGAMTQAFAPFTTTLEDTLGAAVVNASAIAMAVVGNAGEPSYAPPPKALAGRLMNNGGIRNCRGTYEAMLTGAKVDLVTDENGAFSVPSPKLALYRFSSGLPGSECRDAVTGATIRFPMSVFIPSTASTVINPIAMLTVPAADDESVSKRYNGRVTDGRAPRFLWQHVYRLFGYDTDELGVDFLSYMGEALTLGQPLSAAIQGTSGQLMASYSTALELIEPLVGDGASTDDVAAAVVAQLYVVLNATWTASGDGSSALSDPAELAKAFEGAYNASLSEAEGRAIAPTPPRAQLAEQGRRTAPELQPLFDSVARILASSNAQHQKVVGEARTAYKSGASFDTVEAMVRITSISAVQQQELARAIQKLAARVAADKEANVVYESGVLEAQFTGRELDTKVGAKVSALPDLADQITEQQQGLGRQPHGAAAAGRGVHGIGVIVGVSAAFAVAFALVAASVAVAVQWRRRAAAAAAAALQQSRRSLAAGCGPGTPRSAAATPRSALTPRGPPVPPWSASGAGLRSPVAPGSPGATLTRTGFQERVAPADLEYEFEPDGPYEASGPCSYSGRSAHSGSGGDYYSGYGGYPPSSYYSGGDDDYGDYFEEEDRPPVHNIYRRLSLRSQAALYQQAEQQRGMRPSD